MTPPSASGESEGGRDPFSAAKDAVIMDVVSDAKAGEAPVKVAVALVVKFANRAEFEKSGALKAWPSMRLLSAETGLFRSRIDRAIKVLEATGHLTVERPDKRGATHHNRYVLHIRNGRTDAANSEGDDISRIGAANQNPDNGRTGADAMAAPVGPKTLDKHLKGAARPRGPAPDTLDVILDGDGDCQERGLSAHEAPSPASDTRHLGEDRADDLISVADLDRLADEERAAHEARQSALAVFNVAADDLHTMQEVETADFAALWVDAWVRDANRDFKALSAERAAEAMPEAMRSGRDSATQWWGVYRSGLRAYAIACGAAPEAADAAVRAYHAQVGEVVKGRRAVA